MIPISPSGAKAIKEYTQEELENLSIENRVNYNTIIDLISGLWYLDKKVITSIVVAFYGSFDRSNAYIEEMDAYEAEGNPHNIWEQIFEEWNLYRDGYSEENSPF